MTNYRTELSNSNCTMEYTSAGNTRTLLARCRGVGHSFAVVATESQARASRGFYPMQRATGPFTVKLELKGYREFKATMDFLEGYVRASLSTATGMPLMWISVPSRDFWRYGVPIGGVQHGDHVGSNVFAPEVAFESVSDPLDPTLATGFNTATISRFENGFTGDDAARFFYPASAATNDPNAEGEPLYDAPKQPDFPLTPGRPTPGRGSNRPI